MSNEKPKLEEYKAWLEKKSCVKSWELEKNYYTSVTQKMLSDFRESPVWQAILGTQVEIEQDYLVETGYPLFLPEFNPPQLCVKPFESFLVKTYRKNVLQNHNWDQAPNGGWVLPDSWYGAVSDVIRTTVAVKYLDGVEFLLKKIKSLCEQTGTAWEVKMEAREEGYYAAHLYIRSEFEVPRRSWDTMTLQTRVEVQITTQLQDVIRRLLHSYYETARARARTTDSIPWQWDYTSDQFLAGYLGHILHYLEGMIMEVRDRQRRCTP